MRVFKNKWFDRGARTEDVQDSVLMQAAAEVVAGQVEALSLVAEAFVLATDPQVSLLVKEGSIVEVQHHE